MEYLGDTMANQELLKMLDSSEPAQDIVRRWRETNLGVNVDLSGADFRGRDLTYVDFTWADLRGADFSDADLSNAIFNNADLSANFDNGERVCTKLVRARLCRARLADSNCQDVVADDADLIGAYISGITSFANAKLIGTRFSHAHMEGDFANADFRRAKLISANLSHARLLGACIENASFAGADLTKADLACVKGAHCATGLQMTKASNVDNFEICERPWQEQYCDWERLRTFGRLPLFGASYTILLLIPFFFYCIDFYNQKIDLARDWATRVHDSTGPPVDHLADTVRDRLHHVPIPSSSLLLLLSTASLAVASTIYALWCPSRVREFSRDQWCDELGKPLIHYWPYCWKHRWLRLAAFALYIVGGICGAIVVVQKVWWVAGFIWRNSSLTS